ncbi:MAG: hypothetical protein WC443_00420 [Desulfobaccales bacterium]
MIGNISILIFSSLFMCLTAIYIYYKWPDLDIVDVYIIFVGLHFGVSPFIRGLYFGRDVIFDLRNADPWAIGLVFVQVLIILVVVRVISLYFLKDTLQYLKVKYLLRQWGEINKSWLLLIYLWLLAFQIISYYKYGVKTYIMPEDFARMGKSLPYWFTSMRTIQNYLAFAVFLGVFSNIIKSKGYQQYVWIILTIIFVPVVAIYGRRLFVDIMVSGAIFWFVAKEKNIFQLKYVKVGLGLILAFFLVSNIFQSYRDVFQKVGQVNWEKLKNPLAAALDFSTTLTNFAQRPGTWEFSYLVFDHQIKQNGMTSNGKANWEGLKSAIPRFFWPNKNFSVVDEVLAQLYQVKPREIDIGKNLFGMGQVDFGYFSFLIVPTIILLILIVMAGLIKLTSQYPTFLWLFTSIILFFLVNVEENGNEIFFVTRNIMFILTLLGIYILAYKTYEKLSPHQV